MPQGKQGVMSSAFLTLGLLHPQVEANGSKTLNNVKTIEKNAPQLGGVLGALFAGVSDDKKNEPYRPPAPTRPKQDEEQGGGGGGLAGLIGGLIPAEAKKEDEGAKAPTTGDAYPSVPVVPAPTQPKAQAAP